MFSKTSLSRGIVYVYLQTTNNTKYMKIRTTRNIFSTSGKSLNKKLLRHIPVIAFLSSLCFLAAGDRAQATTLGEKSAYVLTKNTSGVDDDITITSYTWDDTTNTLTGVKYDLDIKSDLGGTSGDATQYFDWSIQYEMEGEMEMLQIYLKRDTATSTSHDLSLNIDSSDPSRIITDGSTVLDVNQNFASNNGGYLDGFYIKNSYEMGNISGNFMGGMAFQFGGAILNRDGASTETLKIESITANFIGNYAGGTGGAIENYGSDVEAVIGSIEGDFIGNGAADGGAIRNFDWARIDSIKGDFIKNLAYAGGGAIDNNYGHIGTIEANFIDNAAATDGGAISNNGSIDSISGTFSGNEADALNATGYTMSTNGSGGAISNESEIGTINADFYNNLASRDGGAISNKGTTHSKATIDSITGNFVDNTTLISVGGAITNAINAEIKSISGSFHGNSATGSSTVELTSSSISEEDKVYTQGGQGGAIYNSSKIGTIAGTFTENTAETNGGALMNAAGGTIDTITADFYENEAQLAGGAIHNAAGAVIGDISGNIIGNSSGAEGGAIYNAGSIGILAVDKSITIAGNTSGVGGYAIYNDGTDATINFNAYANKTITVNDAIDGGTLNINNGENGAGASHGRTDYSKVILNNAITDSTINVLNGELVLGSYEGGTYDMDGTPLPVGASRGGIAHSTLNIATGAKVSTNSAKYAFLKGLEIYNSGTLSVGDGDIYTSLYLTGSGEVKLSGSARIDTVTTVTGTDNLISGRGSATVVDDTLMLNAAAELTLSNVGLDADLSITNNSTRENLVMLNSAITNINLNTTSSVDTAHIAEGIDVYDMLNVGVELSSLTVSDSLTFDLNIDDTVYDQMNGLDVGFRLAESGVDGNIFLSTGELLSLDDLDVFININGSRFAANDLYRDANNDLVIIAYVPEPSTATLSLLALAGLMSRRRRRG